VLAEAPALQAPSWRARLAHPAWRLLVLALLAALAVTIFMTINNRGMWEFILPFRGRKILAIIVVGYAIAMSTVVFQTITNNRILTPSIMGFDALYMLIQTIVVFFLGSSRLLMMDPRQRFAVEVIAMVVFASALYIWLFVVAKRSLHLLVLVGIIFGVMFRSVTSFLQRLIAPNDFVVLQDVGFASFNTIDQTLLWVAIGIIGAATLVLIRLLPQFDVLLLGRELAIGLGVNYQRTVTVALVLVTVLVAVSTALVGPITFFGLLVANLAYMLMGTSYHRWVLPAAGLLAVAFLVGGQLVLEQVFTFNSSLSVMIEFLGGLMFIYLLLRGHAR
jgi:iron complex transport system permease protein